MKRYIPISFVRQRAKLLGFDDCGAAKAEPCDILPLKKWLSEGMNADMDYMSKYIDKREDITALFQGAETVFSFLISYNQVSNTSSYPCRIASYALGEDYHKALKAKLFRLIEHIREQYPDFEARVFVDTAPVLEKQWAVRAGLGWIGKNSTLVSKQFGSKVFLAEIVSNYQSDYALQEKDHCGNCNRCIASCPNRAITNHRTIDCNKCISYQTIENKGNIPSHIELNGWIYGCEECIDACIWNIKAPKCHNKEFETSEPMQQLIENISSDSLCKSHFNKARKHSAIERVRFDKLLSNIAKAKHRKD